MSQETFDRVEDPKLNEILDVLHGLPEQPIPEAFAARLEQALAAEGAEIRAAQSVPPPTPVLSLQTFRRRRALAGLAACFMVGLFSISMYNIMQPEPAKVAEQTPQFLVAKDDSPTATASTDGSVNSTESLNRSLVAEQPDSADSLPADQSASTGSSSSAQPSVCAAGTAVPSADSNNSMEGNGLASESEPEAAVKSAPKPATFGDGIDYAKQNSAGSSSGIDINEQIAAYLKTSDFSILNRAVDQATGETTFIIWLNNPTIVTASGKVRVLYSNEGIIYEKTNQTELGSD